jgi:hypothetical protein
MSPSFSIGEPKSCCCIELHECHVRSRHAPQPQEHDRFEREETRRATQNTSGTYISAGMGPRK